MYYVLSVTKQIPVDGTQAMWGQGDQDYFGMGLLGRKTLGFLSNLSTCSTVSNTADGQEGLVGATDLDGCLTNI